MKHPIKFEAKENFYSEQCFVNILENLLHVIQD